MKLFNGLSLALAFAFLTFPNLSLAASAKTHSVFFKIGKINCPALTYYTSMSTSSSTSSDSCENITWIVKNQRDEQERFVAANYALLEEQVSQGKGALISDYATLMNCSGAQTEFGQALRNHFEKVFSSDRSEGKLLDASEMLIRTEPELAKKCAAGA